jgi:hypothetical protein
MIVVRLIGGLGNQMFQYALARHLAIKTNSVLKLDISDLMKKEKNLNHTHRDFELNNFKIKAEIANSNEISEFKSKKIRFITKLILKLFPNINFLTSIIIEKKITYNKWILKYKGNKYLDGYWQSESYFKDIRSQLLEDFTLTNLENDNISDIVKEIKNNDSVSLHIRRGDYISKYSNYYYTQTPNYYYQAVAIIKEKNPNIKVFIFSDEIEWAKENIQLDVEVFFVKPNKSYEDIYLMSLCKHNIIANSTFSWWGAWLNNNQNKICIAPKNWYKNPKMKTDLIPKNWIIL